MKKTNLIISVLVILLVGNFVSADSWTCFARGDVVDFCNPIVPDRTCGATTCKFCMKSYDDVNECYTQGSNIACNEGGGDCSNAGGGVESDSEPPEFDLMSIEDGDVFSSRRILSEFSLNEIADVSYYDLINGRGRWTRVCNNCPAGTPAYSRERSFNEGLNQLQFMAEDVVGNKVYKEVSFFVDSKKPKIRRTEPRRGFADGNFEVQFSEENPVTLTLHYGTSEQRESQILNIEEDCEEYRGKYYCDTYADLEEFNEKTIEYWFVLTDKGENTVESKHVFVSVDTKEPELNNPDSFWVQGEGRYNKYIYFSLDIIEPNFDEVVYLYEDSRGRLREKRLCSRLRDGICETRKSFREGDYDLTVMIKDEAGNSVGYPVNFGVEY